MCQTLRTQLTNLQMKILFNFIILAPKSTRLLCGTRSFFLFHNFISVKPATQKQRIAQSSHLRRRLHNHLGVSSIYDDATRN